VLLAGPRLLLAHRAVVMAAQPAAEQWQIRPRPWDWLVVCGRCEHVFEEHELMYRAGPRQRWLCQACF
jgi:hypothetical protein